MQHPDRDERHLLLGRLAGGRLTLALAVALLLVAEGVAESWRGR
jgi:hypothetical protein